MRFARLCTPTPRAATGSSPAEPTFYFARLDGDRAHALDRAPWAGGHETGQAHPFREQDLRCPVVPSKIVCLGRNYAAHAREVGGEIPSEPLLFLKPPSALVGPGDAIVLPAESRHVEHEAELAVIIGRKCKNVPPTEALSCIFGYACACDVSARDLQRKDGQWARAKGFDTFCPVGPWIETQLDPSSAHIRCRVDGHVKQDSTTADMIFNVPTLVSFVSRMMTLEAGDMILTGTPEGVSPIAAGNVVEVDISGIGVLRSVVTSAALSG
jgi:2-keto-4-pentenoate hydratase/2-oxohepta-3-ene-1,7-dioic acid hydratase in catechol pathway